jgi:hypothetical protein
MQRELEELLSKQKNEKKLNEDFFRKEPVPLQIRKYIAEKCEKEEKASKPKK